MKRESGYYWIKFPDSEKTDSSLENGWEVAYFRNEIGWFSIWDGGTYKDDEIKEINEIKLLPLSETNKILNLCEKHVEFSKLIQNTINYEGTINLPINKWDGDFFINKNAARLILYDEDDDEYYYTISSLSAKGKQLYMGEYENLIILMAYNENRNWDNTEIFILDKNNQLKNEKF